MATHGRSQLVRAALVAALSLSMTPLLTMGLATPASAAISRIPLTAGRTLSGVVGGGPVKTAAFATFRNRPNEAITGYTSTNSWDGITGVTRQGLTGLHSHTNA